MQRLSQKSEGFKRQIELPSLGVLHWEDEPQNIWLLGLWGLCTGEPEGCRKQRLLLNGSCKISHVQRSSTEVTNEVEQFPYINETFRFWLFGFVFVFEVPI